MRNDDTFLYRITIILKNTLKDNSSTPRTWCGITKQGDLEVWLSGEKIFYYPDTGKVECEFSSLSKPLSNDDKVAIKPLLVKILDKLKLGKDTRLDAEKRTDEIKNKHKLNENAAKKRILTDKHLEEINKYEQAIKRGSI